jgi:hypothetical protein
MRVNKSYRERESVCERERRVFCPKEKEDRHMEKRKHRKKERPIISLKVKTPTIVLSLHLNI